MTTRSNAIYQKYLAIKSAPFYANLHADARAALDNKWQTAHREALQQEGIQTQDGASTRLEGLNQDGPAGVPTMVARGVGEFAKGGVRGAANVTGLLGYGLASLAGQKERGAQFSEALQQGAMNLVPPMDYSDPTLGEWEARLSGLLPSLTGEAVGSMVPTMGGGLLAGSVAPAAVNALRGTQAGSKVLDVVKPFVDKAVTKGLLSVPDGMTKTQAAGRAAGALGVGYPMGVGDAMSHQAEHFGGDMSQTSVPWAAATALPYTAMNYLTDAARMKILPGYDKFPKGARIPLMSGAEGLEEYGQEMLVSLAPFAQEGRMPTMAELQEKHDVAKEEGFAGALGGLFGETVMGPADRAKRKKIPTVEQATIALEAAKKAKDPGRMNAAIEDLAVANAAARDRLARMVITDAPAFDQETAKRGVDTAIGKQRAQVQTLAERLTDALNGLKMAEADKFLPSQDDMLLEQQRQSEIQNRKLQRNTAAQAAESRRQSVIDAINNLAPDDPMRDTLLAEAGIAAEKPAAAEPAQAPRSFEEEILQTVSRLPKNDSRIDSILGDAGMTRVDLENFQKAQAGVAPAPEQKKTQPAAAPEKLAISQETHPLLFAIKTAGGMLPKSAAKNPGGEYDGAPEVKDVPWASQLLYGGRRHTPDKMAMEMAEQGLIPDGHPNTLWSAIEAELGNKRQNLRQADTVTDAHMEHWEENESEVKTANDLRPGDRFTVYGEEYEVEGDDTTTGERRLKIRGTQPGNEFDFSLTYDPMHPDGVLKVDRGSLMRAGQARPAGAVSFEETRARINKAVADRKADRDGSKISLGRGPKGEQEIAGKVETNSPNSKSLALSDGSRRYSVKKDASNAEWKPGENVRFWGIVHPNNNPEAPAYVTPTPAPAPERIKEQDTWPVEFSQADGDAEFSTARQPSLFDDDLAAPADIGGPALPDMQARDPKADRQQDLEADREANNTAVLEDKYRLSNPMVGPTGAKIVGYQWVSKIEEGMYRDRRVSDWSDAQTSVPTGRQIVHLFWVETKDGKETLMGVGAAKKALGWSVPQLYLRAKSIQQAERENKKAWDRLEPKYFADASPSASDADLRWRRLNNPDRVMWRMSYPEKVAELDRLFKEATLLEKDGKFLRTSMSDVIRELKRRGWTDAQGPEVTPVTEVTGTNPAPKEKRTWSYGLRARPADLGTIPRGPASIDHEYRDPDRRVRHGKVQYDRELTPDEVSRFELIPLEDEKTFPQVVSSGEAKVEEVTPDAEYSVTSISRPTGRDNLQRGEAVGELQQLQLFVPASTPTAPTTPPPTAQAVAAQAGVVYGEEATLVQTGTFKTQKPIRKVKTHADAAAILAPLGRGNTEKVSVLIVDSKDKPIGVVVATKGEKAKSAAPIDLLAGIGFSLPDGAGFWLAHNHPSGNLIESDADRKMTEAIMNAAKGSALTYKGHVIVSRSNGKWQYIRVDEAIGLRAAGVFSAVQAQPISDPAQRGSRGGVPVYEQEIQDNRAEPLLPNELYDANTARAAGKQLIKMNSLPSDGGIILLNHRNQVVAAVPIAYDQLKKLRTGQRGTGSSMLLDALARTTATGILGYYPGQVFDGSKNSVDTVGNLSSFAEAMSEIRMVDMLGDTDSARENGYSLNGQGSIFESARRPDDFSKNQGGEDGTGRQLAGSAYQLPSAGRQADGASATGGRYNLDATGAATETEGDLGYDDRGGPAGSDTAQATLGPVEKLKRLEGIIALQQRDPRYRGAFKLVEPASTGEKMARDVMRDLFGVDVVFFRDQHPDKRGTKFGGIFSKHVPGTVFVEQTTPKGASRIAFHELMHLMANEQPELYNEMADELRPMLKDFDKYYQGLRDRTGKNRGDAWAEQELFGDFLGDRAQTHDFWNNLADKNPSLFQRVAGFVQKYLRLIRNYIRNGSFGSNEFFSDIEAASDTIENTLTRFAERRGPLAKAVSQLGTTDAGTQASTGPLSKAVSMLDGPDTALTKKTEGSELTAHPKPSRGIETLNLPEKKLLNWWHSVNPDPLPDVSDEGGETPDSDVEFSQTRPDLAGPTARDRAWGEKAPEPEGAPSFWRKTVKAADAAILQTASEKSRDSEIFRKAVEANPTEARSLEEWERWRDLTKSEETSEIVDRHLEKHIRDDNRRVHQIASDVFRVAEKVLPEGTREWAMKKVRRVLSPTLLVDPTQKLLARIVERVTWNPDTNQLDASPGFRELDPTTGAFTYQDDQEIPAAIALEAYNSLPPVLQEIVLEHAKQSEEYRRNYVRAVLPAKRAEVLALLARSASRLGGPDAVRKEWRDAFGAIRSELGRMTPEERLAANIDMDKIDHFQEMIAAAMRRTRPDSLTMKERADLGTALSEGDRLLSRLSSDRGIFGYLHHTGFDPASEPVPADLRNGTDLEAFNHPWFENIAASQKKRHGAQGYVANLFVADTKRDVGMADAGIKNKWMQEVEDLGIPYQYEGTDEEGNTVLKEIADQAELDLISEAPGEYNVKHWALAKFGKNAGKRVFLPSEAYDRYQAALNKKPADYRIEDLKGALDYLNDNWVGLINRALLFHPAKAFRDLVAVPFHVVDFITHWAISNHQDIPRLPGVIVRAAKDALFDVKTWERLSRGKLGEYSEVMATTNEGKSQHPTTQIMDWASGDSMLGSVLSAMASEFDLAGGGDIPVKRFFIRVGEQLADARGLEGAPRERFIRKLVQEYGFETSDLTPWLNYLRGKEPSAGSKAASTIQRMTIPFFGYAFTLLKRMMIDPLNKGLLGRGDASTGEQRSAFRLAEVARPLLWGALVYGLSRGLGEDDWDDEKYSAVHLQNMDGIDTDVRVPGRIQVGKSDDQELYMSAKGYAHPSVAKAVYDWLKGRATAGDVFTEFQTIHPVTGLAGALIGLESPYSRGEKIEAKLGQAAAMLALPQFSRLGQDLSKIWRMVAEDGTIPDRKKRTFLEAFGAQIAGIDTTPAKLDKTDQPLRYDPKLELLKSTLGFNLKPVKGSSLGGEVDSLGKRMAGAAEKLEELRRWTRQKNLKIGDRRFDENDERAVLRKLGLDAYRSIAEAIAALEEKLNGPERSRLLKALENLPASGRQYVTPKAERAIRGEKKPSLSDIIRRL